MKYFLLFLAGTWLTGTINAQQLIIPQGGNGQLRNGQNLPQIGHVYGKVLDAQSGKPIEFASVALIRLRDSSVVNGMLTKPNGDFSLENLPFGQFNLRINFIGYKPLLKRITITPQNIEQDLGNFKLTPNIKALKEVEIVGQKSDYTMAIDKKVFNVDRNLVSVGGTAVDVLKNVPAVNVDIDGNVKVRNGTPTIFIDGKPSTLTLEQIPADAIESVELVTNPSAKYDAEGMTGIINIVLKKNKKAGINGMVMGGAGTGDKYNMGANLNIRQNPINFFINYHANQNNNTGNGTTYRQNFLPDTSFLNQYSNSYSKGLFQFGRIGLDYYIDNRNTLSVSQALARGHFKNNEALNSEVLNKTNAKQLSFSRDNFSEFEFRNYATQLGYKHSFAKPNKEWTADLNYNINTNQRGGNFTTQYYNNASQPLGSPLLQNNNGNGRTSFLTLQTDYSDPISENLKLETGLKATIRDYSSNYNVFDYDRSNRSFQRNDSLSTDYTYQEKIYAAYLTLANQIKNFGYQVGLRAEQYVYAGQIPSKKQTFNPTSARPGLFPSIYLSQKLPKEQELQLNYSRRVNRPNFFQLIPYRDYSDPQNQREGNPGLKPEYTNSFEFSYLKTIQNSSLLATLYFRNTNDLITAFSSPIGRDTLLTKYINANTVNSYGAELTAKTQLLRIWDLTANLNLYQTTLKGAVGQTSLNNSGFSWFGKLNTDLKLPKNLTFQVNATYQAPSIIVQGGGGGRGFGAPPPTAQGTIKGFSGVDIALRKDFLKNRAASLTLSLSDVFNTRQYETNTQSPAFAQDFIRKRESRILRLNFNYRFGKFDNQLFRRKNQKNERDNQQNDQQMGDSNQFRP